MTEKRPTMRDVADSAGVSPMTVSRVVSGDSGVLPETVARVERAIRALGYQRNDMARQLRRNEQTTQTIGLLVDDLANPFFAALAAAVEGAAMLRSSVVLIGSSNDDLRREREVISAFLTRRVDGLILVPVVGSHRFLQRQLALGLKVVCADRPAENLQTDTVLVDNRSAAREAVTHLLRQGHRRIGYLGDREDIWTVRERYVGYTEALAVEGVVPEPALVRHGLRTRPEVAAAAVAMIAQPSPPSALFASNDVVTMGVVDGLHGSPPATPAVALVGFDEFAFADKLSPPVSVVAQDPAQLGATAAQLLFARIAGDTSPPKEVMLMTRLVLRGSGEIAPSATLARPLPAEPLADPAEPWRRVSIAQSTTLKPGQLRDRHPLGGVARLTALIYMVSLIPLVFRVSSVSADLVLHCRITDAWKGLMTRRTGRATLVTITTGLLCLFAALGGAASAASASGGIKGSPQPELKQFGIDKGANGPGSVALEPNGSLVVAYNIGAGNGKTAVCLLNRGGHACSTRVVLTPLSGDDLFGTSEVFVTSANHVVVLQGDCCDNSAAGGDLLFTSTNGGRNFGAPVRIGSLGVSEAALIGGNIVFMAGDNHDGAEVESVPVNASGPPAEIATPIAPVAYNVGVGSYRRGALIAADNLGSDYTTRVTYAAAGKNFDATSSYLGVGTFPHEELLVMSGDALLTHQTTGNEADLLRIFNGKSFGPAHVVPHTAGGGPGWSTMDTDPSGRVHVFDESTHLSPLYDLFEESTSTGASWSAPANLGNAIDYVYFAAALDANGSGLVLGTYPAEGFPVLAPQGVSFTLSRSSVVQGHAVIGSGKGSAAAAGRPVQLQQLRSGLWYWVATTHENASGSFSFSIKGTRTGNYTYRVMATDRAGYVQYGYSAWRSLKVIA
jgi:DNA-binding LacI/PurR family transcriptional regulator